MKLTLILTAAVLGFSSAALAGTPAPLPLAGAGGPIGLAVAAGGYLAYRLYRRGDRH